VLKMVGDAMLAFFTGEDLACVYHPELGFAQAL
jgi:hypothetical protein